MKPNVGLSDKIRQRALEKYVKPALRSGRRRFSIKIKELMQEMEGEGFPPNHPAQFCTAIRKRAFLHDHGIEIEGQDGPPSGKSTTVVLHLKVSDTMVDSAPISVSARTPTEPAAAEDPAARAKRVTDGLRGLLKDEIAAYGGTEAFMRWVRSDEDEAA